MAKVDELLMEVRKTGDRVSQVEKTVSDLAKVKGDAADAVRKILMSGSQAGIGFDGSDQLGLMRACNPHQKALGMGTFLQATYVASGGPATGEFATADQAHRFIEKNGAKAIQKASLAEGSGATGGYTVPVQFYADLQRLIAEESIFKQKAFNIPMQSRSLLVPTLDHSAAPATGTSAAFAGLAASWQPEAATINESEPTFRQVELVARDLVMTCVASNQLLQDNAVALDTLLTSLFRDGVAWWLDYYFLRGNGAGQPQGVLTANAALAVTRKTASTFKLVDAAKMIGKLLPASRKSAFWLAHPSVLEQLIQMTNDATNSAWLVWLNPAGNTANEGPAAGEVPAKLLGLPLYFTEKLPALGTKGDVMLIDAGKYLVGERMGLQIESSPFPYFTTNRTVWRLGWRGDGQPWLNAAITMADGTYTMSPFVVLN